MVPADPKLDIPLQELLDLQPDRLVVAYSGGVDSHVLLHWLGRNLSKNSNTPHLCALHVNHGLNEQAEAWQVHCEQVCKGLGVELFTFPVEVKRDGSLEENARVARYEVFGGFLKSSDLLLLAHHLDDQIETAIFRLFRGNGFVGMPQTRPLKAAKLYRPLLHTSRKEIEAYAHSESLEWIEDDSNLDIAFDRNFIRLKLLPLIRERWPHLTANLNHVLRKEEEASLLLESIAEQDRLSLETDERVILLSGFRELDLLRQKNLLRYWIKRSANAFPAESFVSDAVRQLMSSDSFGLRWESWEINGYRDKAYLMEAKKNKQERASEGNAKDQRWSLDDISRLAALGIRVEKIKGQGLKANLVPELNIRFRQGGEKIELKEGAGSKKFKKLLQDKGIPPWIRDRLPLVYKDEKLIAVPAIPEWGMENLVAWDMRAQGDEDGLLISWGMS